MVTQTPKALFPAIFNNKTDTEPFYYGRIFTYNNISVRLDLAPDDTDDVAALLVLQVVVHHQSHLPAPVNYVSVKMLNPNLGGFRRSTLLCKVYHS
jgi:hypothetical protein